MIDEKPISGRFKWFAFHSKAFWVGLTLEMVLMIGFLDYFTGFELNFFAFYLVPVILAVWRIGRGFGLFVSALCVGVSVAGDSIAGARYSSSLVPVWNIAISFTFFFVLVWILANLRSLHIGLEERVRQRTAALHDEMQERMRLEEEILNISEREQRRIGHDLHDSLCQHLTGVALAGEVLSERLAAKSLPEAKAMDHIVTMTEEAIELTRTLARGLHPFELKGEGFTDALRELAATITAGFNTPCAFECDKPVVIGAPDVAIHLFRITQEALTNAVKHSHAGEIVVRLSSGSDALMLTICDDGIGMPAKIPTGMGLRTMAYRASVIGATFNVAPRDGRGTCVACKLPLPVSRIEIHAAQN